MLQFSHLLIIGFLHHWLFAFAPAFIDTPAVCSFGDFSHLPPTDIFFTQHHLSNSPSLETASFFCTLPSQWPSDG